MELRELISSICPVSHSFDSEIINNGMVYNIPSLCKKVCRYKCTSEFKSLEYGKYNTCSHKFNFVLFSFNEVRFCLFGFVLDKTCKIPRKRKKEIKEVIVSKEYIEKWKESVEKFLKKNNDFLEEKIKEPLESLHDVKTAISLILRNTEEMIMDEEGETIDEKINNSESKKKALFKSVSLLEERIKLMDLISNPQAASHGQKRKTPIYKIIDKLVKIHYPIANKKDIKIIINGSSFNSPFLYDSFSTVPLVLIDNAIKYSRRDQEIIINVNDQHAGSVEVSIESYSPRIYRRDIFTKNIRGSYAQNITRCGSGLGLYLAKIVAEANGFEVFHEETGTVNTIDEIEYITNIFSFKIRA